VVQREGGVGAAGGWEAQEEVECCVGGFAVADDEDPLPGVAVEDAYEGGGGALQVGAPGFAAGCEWPVGFEGMAPKAVAVSAQVRPSASP
jgi:hypothetical protein